jgi:catalase
VHSVAWDEAQKISGKDPDFHRRDLWDAIETGNFPEWELGVQLVPEKDEHVFEFDLLDPTKIIPEELVPVKKIGKLTLNRNPDNFFAETEQVAFHPGHIVPGIDFTNDPLLQGRLFSYTDTQLSRLGSPNFHEIPINRSLSEVHNNQRDGHMRQTINKSKTHYDPNTISKGCPFQAMASKMGFTSYPERIDAKKVRARSKSFLDHFSQATLFFNSQSEPEKIHIINAFSFELGKVQRMEIRQRVVNILTLVDKGLADKVAKNLGLIAAPPERPVNHSFPADANPEDYQPVTAKSSILSSAALSMEHTRKDTIATRKIAVLIADGFDDISLTIMKSALEEQKAVVKIIAPVLGSIKSANGKSLVVDESFLTASSVLYDAVYVPGGSKSVNALLYEPDAIHFINEAYRHCKAIAADGDGILLIKASYISVDEKSTALEGVITDNNHSRLVENFIKGIAGHRFWKRELERKVPA